MTPGSRRSMMAVKPYCPAMTSGKKVMTPMPEEELDSDETEAHSDSALLAVPSPRSSMAVKRMPNSSVRSGMRQVNVSLASRQSSVQTFAGEKYGNAPTSSQA